jgi:hypothetical protein
MAGNRRPEQVLEWLLPGRRKKGRPGGRWTKGINNAMVERERGMVEGQWMDREEHCFGTGRRE